jgi:type VI secretion system protein ImpJ
MARYNKVVWSEGMFLGPHHFQQWDRYHESILDARIKSISSLYWGLSKIEINEEGLENGTYTLLSCQGVFPSGIQIDIPGTDKPPPSRTIEDYFDPSMEFLEVYLAVPSDRPGSVNCNLDNSGTYADTRYYRDFAQVIDETTGENELEIPVANKNLKILFEGESLDAHDYIKISELQRTTVGYAIRDNYIPPCTTISASPRLVRVVRRLTELLTAKSDELREHGRERGDGFYEFGSADMTNFFILQTINSFIPELNHFYRTERGHPEELFRLLARFAGALTAFSVNIRPINLPSYEHEYLAECYEELEITIQELMQMLGPSIRYIPVPLTKVEESIYEAAMSGDLSDNSVYRFYLAVRGEGDQGDLIREIQRRAKVASDNDITFLIGRALRGIALNHIITPPEAIATKSGFSYFILDPRSDFWQGVKDSQKLDIYIPVSLGEIELELMALEE